MGKGVERVFKKFLPKLNAASLINTSWHTDADGFLEHSLSQGCLYYKGPALQKINNSIFLIWVHSCISTHVITISGALYFFVLICISFWYHFMSARGTFLTFLCSVILLVLKSSTFFNACNSLYLAVGRYFLWVWNSRLLTVPHPPPSLL